MGNGTIYQNMEQRRKNKAVNKIGSVFYLKLPILLSTIERRLSTNVISLKHIEK